MVTEYFAPAILPGVALLILSTTMRIGNVRMALVDIARGRKQQSYQLLSYELFVKRAKYLCAGLQLLNLSLVVLLCSALIRVISAEFAFPIPYLSAALDLLSFIILLLGGGTLYLESRLTGKSIIAQSEDLMH